MEKQDYEINLAKSTSATGSPRTSITASGIFSQFHPADGRHDGHLYGRGYRRAPCLSSRKRWRRMEDRPHSIHDLHDESGTSTRRSGALRHLRFLRASRWSSTRTATRTKSQIHLLSVVKEGLSNIIRHSDRHGSRYRLRSSGALPARYQDNGAQKEQSGDGIGLKNIEQRVEGVGGIATSVMTAAFSRIRFGPIRPGRVRCA